MGIDYDAVEAMAQKQESDQPQRKGRFKKFLEAGPSMGEIFTYPARTLQSFLLNAANTATVGAVPQAVDAATQMITGDPTRQPAQNAMDKYTAMHPAAGSLGKLAGYMVPATVAERAVVSGGKAISPAIGNFLKNRTLGRLTTAGAGSALDSTAQTVMKEGELQSPEEIAKDALWGIGGQTLFGELGGRGAKMLSGSEEPKNAAMEVMDQLGVRTGTGGPTGRELPLDQIIANRQRLGDDATLMDASPELRSFGKDIITDSQKVVDAPNITSTYSAGGDKRLQQIRQTFEEEVYGSMPQSFKTNTQSGQVTGARSLAGIKEAGKRNRQALQKEYDNLFANISPEDNPLFSQGMINRRLNSVYGGPARTQGAKADRQIIGELMEHATGASRSELPEGAADMSDYISPRNLLEVKKGVDEMINDAMLGQTPDLARARQLYQVKDTIDEALHGGLGEDFTKLNQSYSNEFSAERASELAYRVLTGGDTNQKLSADALDLAMQNSPGDNPAFVEGATRGIMELITKDQTGLSGAQKMIKSGQFQEKLTNVFGEEAATNIVQSAQKALDMTESAKQLKGKAVGPDRREMMDALTTAVRGAVVAGALPKLVGKSGAMSSTPAAAGAALAGIRSAHSRPAPLATRYIDELLTQQGGNADYSLRQAEQLANDPTWSSSLLGRWSGSAAMPQTDLFGGLLNDFITRQWGVAPSIAATTPMRSPEED